MHPPSEITRFALTGCWMMQSDANHSLASKLPGRPGEYREIVRFLVQIGRLAFQEPPDIEHLEIEFPKSSNREFTRADQVPKIE